MTNFRKSFFVTYCSVTRMLNTTVEKSWLTYNSRDISWANIIKIWSVMCDPCRFWSSWYCSVCELYFHWSLEIFWCWNKKKIYISTKLNILIFCSLLRKIKFTSTRKLNSSIPFVWGNIFSPTLNWSNSFILFIAWMWENITTYMVLLWA